VQKPKRKFVASCPNFRQRRVTAIRQGAVRIADKKAHQHRNGHITSETGPLPIGPASGPE
jgi:hypothetical protein